MFFRKKETDVRLAAQRTPNANETQPPADAPAISGNAGVSLDAQTSLVLDALQGSATIQWVDRCAIKPVVASLDRFLSGATSDHAPVARHSHRRARACAQAEPIAVVLHWRSQQSLPIAK